MYTTYVSPGNEMCKLCFQMSHIDSDVVDAAYATLVAAVMLVAGPSRTTVVTVSPGSLGCKARRLLSAVW